MKIVINGEPHDLAEDTTASQVITILDLAGRRLAMEINGEIVPRSRFESHTLREGDRVEIVHAIGGG